MRIGGMLAAAGVALVAVLAPSASANWHAVAGKLPPRYHLLESEPAGKNGLDEVCYGGVPRKYVDEEFSCDDNSLTVFTLSRGAKWGLFDYPSGPEHPVTIRGRRGHWHWLKEEGSRYARELVWSPRARLRVSVVAMLKLGLHDLLDVGRHIRPVREHAWKLLLRQTTYVAQEGRFDPGMRRVRAASGRVDGDPWRLDVLIPRDYPLSRNDLRPACLELVYRRVHGRGERCTGDWQRVGGHVFIFGWLPSSWRRYVVHFYRNVKGTRGGRTYAIYGWKRWKFYARALPTETCDLYFTNPDDPENGGGGVSRPRPYSPDYKRCGFGAR